MASKKFAKQNIFNVFIQNIYLNNSLRILKNPRCSIAAQEKDVQFRIKNKILVPLMKRKLLW